MLEKFLKVKGRRARLKGRTGVICGYFDNYYIMLILNGPDGWELSRLDEYSNYPRFFDHDFSMANPKGYFLVEDDEILPFKFGTCYVIK